MLVKVVAVQAAMGERLTLADRIHIFKQRPDFVCLPEYWLLGETVGDFHRAALERNSYLDYLTRLSDELSTCLIGGTVVEADGDRLYNVCPVINRGTLIAGYRKMYPVAGEKAKGISAGDKTVVVDIHGVRVGLMICGDVFYPEVYAAQAAQEVDLIVIPTTSPHRPDDSLEAKRTRDHGYFVAGALKAGAYAVKVCGVGHLFGKPLQGRSLVAAPWGLLEVTDSRRESDRRILSVTLDIDELRDFRRKIERSGIKEA